VRRVPPSGVPPFLFICNVPYVTHHIPPFPCDNIMQSLTTKFPSGHRLLFVRFLAPFFRQRGRPLSASTFSPLTSSCRLLPQTFWEIEYRPYSPPPHASCRFFTPLQRKFFDPPPLPLRCCVLLSLTRALKVPPSFPLFCRPCFAGRRSYP